MKTYLLPQRTETLKSLLLLGTIALLAACGRREEGPSPERIEAKVRSALPAWFEVEQIIVSTEEPFEGDFRSRVEAQLLPREELVIENDLIEVEIAFNVNNRVTRLLQEMDSDKLPKDFEGKLREKVTASSRNAVALLPVAEQGKVKTWYGTIQSRKTDEGYHIGTIEWEGVGDVSTGKPLSSFTKPGYLHGSAAIKAKEDEIFTEINADVERELQREKERENRIIQAFQPGRTYSGTWVCRSYQGKVVLQITELDGKDYRGILFDPSAPDQTKPVAGMLNLKPREKYHATLIGIMGEGMPKKELTIEGLSYYQRQEARAATTYFRMLEVVSIINFKLIVGSDGTLGGEGKLTSDDRGNSANGTLDFKPVKDPK